MMRAALIVVLLLALGCAAVDVEVDSEGGGPLPSYLLPAAAI